MKSWQPRILCILIGLCGVIESQAHSKDPAKNSICYLNGADGMSSYFKTKVPEYFKTQFGISFVPVDMGSRGDIKIRAQRFRIAVQDILKKTPDFQCHLFAYSMGGLVARYAFAKMKIQTSSVEIPWNTIFKSLTTFASPHRGTPMADLIGEFFPEMEGSGLETLSERALRCQISKAVLNFGGGRLCRFIPMGVFYWTAETPLHSRKNSPLILFLRIRFSDRWIRETTA